jgi:hypothetical protein
MTPRIAPPKNLTQGYRGAQQEDRSDAQIATDRATIRLVIIVALARCIQDDGSRLCGVGMRGRLHDAIASQCFT